MGWQVIDGQRYYYRHVNNDGQWKTVYVGKGPAAEVAEAMDAERAEARRARTAKHASERALAARVEEAAAPADELLDALVAASLVATGHHTDQRRRWRRPERR
jgi:hypothetical protein